MGFSRQEYWSELPFPPPGIGSREGSNTGEEPKQSSPNCQAPFISTSPHPTNSEVHLGRMRKRKWRLRSHHIARFHESLKSVRVLFFLRFTQMNAFPIENRLVRFLSLTKQKNSDSYSLHLSQRDVYKCKHR